jgi:uncharacterized SAM-binding protein YcdF (DUF218 family)
MQRATSGQGLGTPPGVSGPQLGRSTLARVRMAVWRVGIALALVFGAMSLPIVSDTMIGNLQTSPALSPSQLDAARDNPHAAIVVLSAGRQANAPEYGGETVDALGLERVRYAAYLAKQTKLPVLVTGGLARPGRAALGQLMADVLLQDYGLKAGWIEARSATTAENAIFSAAILRDAGIDQVLLVTHAWHMPRAKAAFEDNGIAVVPAPTAFVGQSVREGLQDFVPSMNAFRMAGYAVHEWIGLAWYRVIYGYRWLP